MAGRVHQRIILDNIEFLVHNIKYKIQDILDSLVQADVLSTVDRNNLMGMYQKPEDKAKALCDHYLFRFSHEDWKKFLHILEIHQIQTEFEKPQRKVTMSSGKKNQLLGEANLVTKEDDVLDYSIYAESIAELLTAPNTTSPISIGLFGDWGSGKSALLGLIEEELTSQAKLQELTHGWVFRNGDRYWCILRNGQLHFSNKEYDIENSFVIMLRGKRCKIVNNKLVITSGDDEEEQSVWNTNINQASDENDRDIFTFRVSGDDEKEQKVWKTEINQASTRQTSYPGEFEMSRDANTYLCEIHGDTLYYCRRDFHGKSGPLRLPMLLPGKQIEMRQFTDCSGFEISKGKEDKSLGDAPLCFFSDEKIDARTLFLFIRRIIKGEQEASKPGTSKQQFECSGLFTTLLVFFTLTMWVTYHMTCQCGNTELEKETESNITTQVPQQVIRGKHCNAMLVISSLLTAILTTGICIFAQQLHANGFFSAMKFMFKTWQHLVKTPVQDRAKLKNQPRCLIPVRFNSWEYAGCSKLWAGIVVKLCDEVEDHFGRWTVFYYRIMDDVLQQRSNSTSISGFCIVLSQIMLLLSLILPIICISIYFGVTKSCGLPDFFISIALFIPTTLASVRLLFQMYKLGIPYSNFVKALTHKMVKPKFDEELGYMYAVKKEVLLINRLFSYMSMLGDLNYIPVIFVDDLDRCDPTKIKTMFEALHIMFNDPNLKFYSIVAVEQRSLCNALNTPVSSEETSNSSIMSAMDYLRKIIHLPICLPPGNNVTTQKFLKMVCPAASTSINRNDANEDQNDNNANGNRAHMQNIENVAIRGQHYQNNRQPELINVDFESTFDKCISLLYESPYHIQSNPRHLKRIGNICNIACRLIFKTEPKFFNEKFVLFLLMAEQWPVRTSAFLYQAFETTNGRHQIRDHTHLKDYNTRFKELLKLPPIISDLINFDECPNEFKGFLEKYKLTFQDLRTFKPYMINLAGYIQELIAKADEIKRVQ